MGKSNRDANDLYGWTAAFLEWSFTWILCADVEKNILLKEDIRRMFNTICITDLSDTLINIYLFCCRYIRWHNILSCCRLIENW